MDEIYALTPPEHVAG